MPEDHALASLARIPLKSLHGERVRLLRDNPHFGRLLRDACAARGAMPDFRHAADDFAELLWLVSAGLGCCPCSLLLTHHIPPGAVLRSLVSAALKLKICLLLPHPTAHPAAMALAGIAAGLKRKPVP